MQLAVLQSVFFAIENANYKNIFFNHLSIAARKLGIKWELLGEEQF